MVADESTLRSRWPGYSDALIARTPIRGSISLPLRDELRGIGALDLYIIPPRDVGSLSLRDALSVSEEVAAVLRQQNRRGSTSSDGPAWLDAPAAQRRSTVWQAIGFVNSAFGVPSPDALALLRAHALASGHSLDELAAQVINREVPVADLALDRDTTS